MSSGGGPRIVKLCAATNNSSSESQELASDTTTTTDGDVDLPMFESWYRTGAASPPDDTDHTSLAVQASNSSPSVEDAPQTLGNLRSAPDRAGPSSVAPHGSAAPLLASMDGSAAATIGMGVTEVDRTNVVFEGGKEYDTGSSGLELSESSSKQLETLNQLQVSHL